MPFRPDYEGEIPTLGWHVLTWITDMLAAPDKGEYEPFVPTREQAEFILRYYELDPRTGNRKIRRGVISRPRGWGKSPFLAALAAAEALADVVPDGWDANGRPVGKPWSTVRTPTVQIAAVSETQTRNSWSPLLEMLREGPVIDAYDIDPMDGFVALPRGRISPITASASSVKGARAVFAVMDQTEEWTSSNGGQRLADVMRSNSTKVGGSFIESPNAYTPGMDSVAEQTANAWRMLRESKRRDESILYDHREAAEFDLSNRPALLEALAYVYGDSAVPNGGWVDLERVADDIYDPSQSVQQSRADFLNQITHSADSWLSALDTKAIEDREKVVSEEEPITLGFDGSRRRKRGVTDATALVGCRVSDGHLFTIRVWEQPDNFLGEDGWEVPVHEVDAQVRETLRTHNVVGFFADPAKWESYISEWEAAYGKKLKVKASANHPIERWVGGASRATTWVRAIESLENAILQREVSYDGSSVLTRHFLNARRRQSTRGMQIAKEFPDSPRKIDAAIAAILAYEARSQALSAGLAHAKKRPRVIRR